MSTDTLRVEPVETERTTIKLGEVARFVRGVTFKPADVTDDGSGVICLRTKNVQATLDLSDVIRIPPHFVRRDEQYVQHGDLVVSSANSWNMVGKASWVVEPAEPMAVGGFISVLRASNNKLDARYLYWWFTSDVIQRRVRSFGRQTTNISNLNFDRCLDMEIPLPSLPEQRRITAILDQVDDQRAKRRRTMFLSDGITNSLFADMQARSIEVEETRFGDLINGIQNGTYVPSSDYGSGAPIIRIADFGGGEFLSLDNLNRVRISESEAARYALASYDLLINRVNAMSHVGKAAMVASVSEPTVFESNMMRVRVDPGLIAPEFALAWLQTPDARRQIRASAKQAINQASVNQTDIASLQIPLPNRDVQSRFVRRMYELESLDTARRVHLAKLDELFASLQHRAFTGQL